MKHRVLCSILAASLICTSLTGCESKEGNQLSSYMSNNKDIQLSISETASTKEKNELTWVELDQLKSCETIRNKIDDYLNVVKFDQGSKNGVIFIDEENRWCGNSTLKYAFANKEFVKTYWEDKKLKGDIGKLAMEQYSDINSEETGVIAAINSYYNIMSENSDGTSGLMEYMSRKDAMAAIFRADSQVRMVAETDFDKLFGYDEYNFYAYNLKDCSWFNTEDGSLNAYTYYTSITRAEAMYMIVQRYFKDEYDNMKNVNTELKDCKKAEDIFTKYKVDKGHAWETYALEDALEKPENGVPEDLYKAIIICNKHGIVGSTTNWNKGIRYGELLNMLVNAYLALYNDSSYPVNAKFGTNESGKAIEQNEIPVIIQKEETDVGAVKKGEVIPADPIDEVLEKYKSDINMTDEQIAKLKKDSEGYTFDLVDTKMKVAYCYYLNLRSGPSTDFDIIREIPEDTEIHIIAKCKENGWYRVIADGYIGYQCGVFFRK